MKKVLFFAILFAGCVFALNAQTKSEFQIGIASPQGDFADDDEDDFLYDGSGIAGTGFYFGYKLIAPLNSNGLFWTLNAGVMYNDLQKDFKDDIEEELDDEDYDDYSLPKYINIPLLAGLQLEKEVSDNVKLFGEAGLGLNILKITNLSYSGEDYYGNNFESTESYEPSIKLGYKIGAGIVIQDKFTIALNYMILGSHKVKYEWEEVYDGDKDSDNDKFDKALPVRSLNITLGIRF